MKKVIPKQLPQKFVYYLKKYKQQLIIFLVIFICIQISWRFLEKIYKERLQYEEYLIAAEDIASNQEITKEKLNRKKFVQKYTPYNAVNANTAQEFLDKKYKALIDIKKGDLILESMLLNPNYSVVSKLDKDEKMLYLSQDYLINLPPSLKNNDYISLYQTGSNSKEAKLLIEKTQILDLNYLKNNKGQDTLSSIGIALKTNEIEKITDALANKAIFQIVLNNEI